MKRVTTGPASITGRMDRGRGRDVLALAAEIGEGQRAHVWAHQDTLEPSASGVIHVRTRRVGGDQFSERSTTSAFGRAFVAEVQEWARAGGLAEFLASEEVKREAAAAERWDAAGEMHGLPPRRLRARGRRGGLAAGAADRGGAGEGVRMEQVHDGDPGRVREWFPVDEGDGDDE